MEANAPVSATVAPVAAFIISVVCSSLVRAGRTNHVDSSQVSAKITQRTMAWLRTNRLANDWLVIYEVAMPRSKAIAAS